MTLTMNHKTMTQYSALLQLFASFVYPDFVNVVILAVNISCWYFLQYNVL